MLLRSCVGLGPLSGISRSSVPAAGAEQRGGSGRATGIGGGARAGKTTRNGAGVVGGSVHSRLGGIIDGRGVAARAGFGAAGGSTCTTNAR